MKIGLFSTFMSPIADPDMIQAFAQNIEAMGVESLWMGEHVVLFDITSNPYPGSRDGKLPVPDGGGMLDTVATFGFIAGCTSTLRLGTGITLLPQRNPIYTAKEFTTLDWLSRGRIDFGIGVGWCQEEVEACGYSFHDRGARCDEFIEVIQKLWTDPVVNFEGKTIQLKDCRMDPKPVQTGGVPMIIGGHSPAGFKRAAKYGAGWYGFQLNLAQTEDMKGALTLALNQAGRSWDDFELIITPPYQITPDLVKAYEDLGVDRLILHLGSQKPDRITERLTLVSDLMAALS